MNYIFLNICLLNSIWAIVNKAVVNIHVIFFVQIQLFGFLGSKSKGIIAKLYDNHTFSWQEIADQFFRVVVPFYSLTSNV